MIPGLFDPFSNMGNRGGRGSMPSASIHIGIVKSYDSTTKTCMVSLPTISGIDAVGPMQVMNALVNQFHAPEVDDTVVVAFIDGEFNNAIVLGRIAY